MMDSAHHGAAGGSGSEEDDKCVPRAAVYKMIKDCTPQIRVSGEAKEFFVQCCNEFIHRLSLQANGVCEQQAKKLIHPDHIVTGSSFVSLLTSRNRGFSSALDNLGFSSYKTNCLNAMETAQEEMAQKRKKLHRKPTSIYTQEELRRQQEILFEQVRTEKRKRVARHAVSLLGARRIATIGRRRLGTNAGVVQRSAAKETRSHSDR